MRLGLIALLPLCLASASGAMSFQAVQPKSDGSPGLVDPDKSVEKLAPRDDVGDPAAWNSQRRTGWDARSDPRRVDRSAPKDYSPLQWLYGR